MIGLLTAIPGILKALTGFADTAKSISGDIARTRIAAREAETTEKKVVAEEETKTLQARRDVLLAEAPGSRMNQLVRTLLSLPAVYILWKIIVWDRGFGWGTTDGLSTQEWSYIWMVCGFYLLARTVEIAKR
jgi:hypothetical protein